jgi:hypothetical protein
MNLPAEEQNPSSMKANMEKKKPAASFVFTLSKNERDWMDKASEACLEDDILSFQTVLTGHLFFGVVRELGPNFGLLWGGLNLDDHASAFK